MYGKLRMNKINQNKNKTDVKKINALLWIFQILVQQKDNLC